MLACNIPTLVGRRYFSMGRGNVHNAPPTYVMKKNISRGDFVEVRMEHAQEADTADNAIVYVSTN